MSGGAHEKATGQPLAARLVPHPVLTVTVAVVWLLLMNEVSVGGIILGLLLGLVVPQVTRTFWTQRPRIRRPLKIAEYAVIVLWDIVMASINVAYVVLFKTNRQIRPHFIAIPLDIYSPEAITTLAGTITMTPGTVSADLSACGRALLVHCLDTGDPDGEIANIKRRYEARLKEIFE